MVGLPATANSIGRHRITSEDLRPYGPNPEQQRSSRFRYWLHFRNQCPGDPGKRRAGVVKHPKSTEDRCGYFTRAHLRIRQSFQDESQSRRKRTRVSLAGLKLPSQELLLQPCGPPLPGPPLTLSIKPLMQRSSDHPVDYDSTKMYAVHI